jgi:hypothetical protein
VKPGKKTTVGQPAAGLPAPYAGDPGFGTPINKGTVWTVLAFGTGLNRVISKLDPVESIGDGTALCQRTVSGPAGFAGVGGDR